MIFLVGQLIIFILFIKKIKLKLFVELINNQIKPGHFIFNFTIQIF